MFKTEIVCDNCGAHYIIVTQYDTDSKFCSFCSEPLILADVDEEEYEDIE